MTDVRIRKLADVLVNYSVAIRSGDKVLIEGNVSSEPILKEIYVEVLKSGGHPLMSVNLNDIDYLFFQNASDEQLKYIHEPQRYTTENYDVHISVIGLENTKSLSNVDPIKSVIRDRAQKELRKIFMERISSGDLRWVGTIFPTNAYAQDAEMSLSEYEDFFYGACLPNAEDPIGYWKRFSVRQDKIVKWLRGKKRVHVIGPETDLSLDITDRSFVNCDAKLNMPDGEVFTGPVEDSADGHVYFSYPAIRQGREVIGVRLWFKKGQVVKAKAEKNEDFLLKTLDTDEGARRIGEFAIGTNEGITKFTRQILFDEKINGSFHMALGAGVPMTGSLNESAIHWDLVCDLRKDGEIWVDDELLYKDGKFVI
jgi:aminopeptidase